MARTVHLFFFFFFFPTVLDSFLSWLREQNDQRAAKYPKKLCNVEDEEKEWEYMSSLRPDVHVEKECISRWQGISFWDNFEGFKNIHGYSKGKGLDPSSSGHETALALSPIPASIIGSRDDIPTFHLLHLSIL